MIKIEQVKKTVRFEDMELWTIYKLVAGEGQCEDMSLRVKGGEYRFCYLRSDPINDIIRMWSVGKDTLCIPLAVLKEDKDGMPVLAQIKKGGE